MQGQLSRKLDIEGINYVLPSDPLIGDYSVMIMPDGYELFLEGDHVPRQRIGKYPLNSTDIVRAAADDLEDRLSLAVQLQSKFRGERK